ncbi:unnamed protein product [Spirodela intermedia]|uniref:Retroviral polymerase SH3-like domain-containing protein n=1 Tax=Spirodela intermedia TaxID=51605 RepID=A0A7I8K846_SPIIN|nr:unnamed protein product [Spirodela intermedia]
MNRTLLGQAYCMLLFAVSTTCHIVNKSPASATNFKTLEKVWLSNLPDYSNLKIFGYPAYVHVNDGKLEPRAKKCIFFGYASGVKGYKL